MINSLIKRCLVKLNKEFIKNYSFLFCSVFAIFSYIGFVTRSEGAIVQAVTISSDTTSYTQDNDYEISDSSGGITCGIYTEPVSGETSDELNLVITSNATGTITVSNNNNGNALGFGIISPRQTNNFELNGNIFLDGSVENGVAYLLGINSSNINSLSNYGTISVSANAMGSSGKIYNRGVSSDSNIGSLVNFGLISVTGQSHGSGDAAVDMGIYSKEVGTIYNFGDISSSSEAFSTNGYAFARGVLIDGDIHAFYNYGTISSLATSLADGISVDATAVARGVLAERNLDLFFNSGILSSFASTTGSDTIAYAIGVGSGGTSWGSIGNFSNTGIISYSATASGANSKAGAFGVFAGGNIDNFSNSGIISASAEASGLNSQANALGVGAKDDIDNFINSGIITAQSEGKVMSISAGVSATNLTAFNNTGIIFTSVEGIDSESIAFASGVSVDLTLTEFLNSGDILAQGEGNNLLIFGVGAMPDSLGIFSTLVNEGSIISYAKISNNNPETAISSGIYAAGNNSADDPSIWINRGTIEAEIDTPENVNLSNVGLYGIYVKSGYLSLSNYGKILFEKNNSDITPITLAIASGANVKLIDKLAITFGQSSVDRSQRPIFVQSGATLDLNDSKIGVYIIDSKNIQLNAPYYLINNYGTVSGEWSEDIEFQENYSNPNFQIRWYGDNRDANSALIFSYSPAKDSITAPVGQMLIAPLVFSSFINQIIYFSPTGNLAFIDDYSQRQPIMFASSALSDVSPIMSYTDKEENNFWVAPVYIDVKAEDLGFDADAYGFALGFGKRFSEHIYAALFAEYIDSNIDFKVREAAEGKQDILGAGLNLMYFSPPWYVRISNAGYRVNHQYTGYTGFNYELNERAAYKSKGYQLETAFGCFYGKRVKLIPEVGISYNYYQTDKFQTEVPLSPTFERIYECNSLNVFKLIAALETIADISGVSYYGVFRIEQAINNNDPSFDSYIIDQSKYSLKEKISNTTFVFQTGIRIALKKNFNLEIGSEEQINNNYKEYIGKMLLGYKF